MAEITQAFGMLLKERRRQAGEPWMPTTVDYEALRRSGASPFEALDAIVSTGNAWDKPSLLINCLPRGLQAGALLGILAKHQIHPLSLALCLGDRRRAVRLLARLGFANSFRCWVGPGGRFRLQDHPQVGRFPPGLLLRGDSLIADCPALTGLGEGLRCMIGDLTIIRCPRLRRLPDGLETIPLTGTKINTDGSREALAPLGGNLILEDCDELLGFGEGTRIRGQVIVRSCPKWLTP